MLLLGLFFSSLAVAAPTTSLVVHEKRAISRLDINEGSQRIERDAIIPLRIALAQSNLEKGYDHLMSVSDPKSENFGKHWSLKEIHSEFAPSDETIEAVKAWLENAGIRREKILESDSRGWLGVDIPAGDAERLFATEYYARKDGNGNVDVGCDRYHVPSYLSNHIDFIKPGVMLSSFRKRSIDSATGSSPATPFGRYGHSRPYHHPKHRAPTCGDSITPSCIKALYDIPEAKYSQPVNKVGVFEEGDFYDQPSLNDYFAKYIPQIPAGTHPKLVSINGAEAPAPLPNPSTGESNLDLELIYALTYPQKIILYQEQPTPQQNKTWWNQVPGSSSNKEFYVEGRGIVENLLNAIDGAFCSQQARKAGADCGTAELTRVLSVSYGVSELFMPEGVTKRACNEYMKLGLKGHTVLVASGDYGPAGVSGCVNPAQIENTDIHGRVFNPSFPAVCPFVTSVGATQLNHGETVKDPESAMYQPSDSPSKFAIFGSSGGFSNYFPQPSYQDSAVAGYLTDHNPGYPGYVFNGKSTVGDGGGVYAKGGRGFPDISANGANLEVFSNNQLGQFDGTSLATPIWAGIITLINEERTAAGKGPVGFINPVLYQNAGIFNDITTGNAPGCNTEGFTSVSGWDPITGLGTPNYPELLKVFMALP